MKQLVKILPLVAAMIIMGGCGQKGKPVVLNEQKTILYAEFMHEVNSFNPVFTYERDFRADHLFFGNDVIASAIEEGKQLAGFLQAVDDMGGGMVKTVPLVQAKSMSGGPVDSLFYKRIKETILEGVRSNSGAAGLYLSLHGAMGVQGMFDPEGEIIKEIREAAGPGFVIAVSFDLHANNTVRRAENADIIVGYHTNPHRDHFQTAYRATELLLRTVAGEIDPVMVVKKMKLLKGGGMNIDLLPPFRKIFSTMRKMEKEQGVLSVSFFPVHIWIDDPELGYSTIAITDGNAELAVEKAALIADMAWEARTVPQPEGLTPQEAIEMARKKRVARALGTVVFCDISDAVGTGTPGESTWILDALMKGGKDLRTYISVRDEEAALEAWDYGIGDTVSLLLGGKIDTVYNKSVSYSGEIIFREETSLGKTVIVRNDGLHVIVSELPLAGWYTSDYKKLGLNLMKADIVVVKNLFPFRYRFLLYNRKTINIVTPGLSNINPSELHYQYLPRPIYPLDEIESW
ncbi:MAG: M81 family metallopeptidase [Bacteroidales bacterium]|jgi:microcystin degradation protein MlrC|nr:M81 family metallopeptidase [Bacteroidales bacterium]